MNSNEIAFLAGLAVFLIGAARLALPPKTQNRNQEKGPIDYGAEVRKIRQRKEQRRRVRHQVYRLQRRLGRIHRH